MIMIFNIIHYTNYYIFQESTENIEDSREDEGDEVDAEVMK